MIIVAAVTRLPRFRMAVGSGLAASLIVAVLPATSVNNCLPRLCRAELSQLSPGHAVAGTPRTRSLETGKR